MSRGRFVRVHKNLIEDCWSVYGLTGRGVTHRKSLAIRNANMVVSEAGRQRVLTENVRNVHAYIRGLLDTTTNFPTGLSKEIRYNPYRFRGFYCYDDRFVKLLPVIGATAVLFNEKGEVHAFHPIYDLTGESYGQFNPDQYPYF